LTNVFKQANFAGTSFEGIGLSSSGSSWHEIYLIW